MDLLKDICGICLREVNWSDVQKVDVNKLGYFIRHSLLPKWELDQFRDHLICDSCVANLRTMDKLKRYSLNSNRVVMKMRPKMGKMDLKQLAKFKSMPGDFSICRLCLEMTKHVAIYLYDSSNNLLPMEYINDMLEYTNICLAIVENTLNPILCFICWQRIQIAFGYRKHLDLVTAKVSHYQKILKKIYLDKEDLQDILYMWDKLGPSDIDTYQLESDTSISNQGSPLQESSRPADMPRLEPEYAIFDDHCYSKHQHSAYMINPDRSYGSSRESETSSFIDVENDIPFLTPHDQEDVKEFKEFSVSERSLRTRNPAISYTEPKITSRMTTKKPEKKPSSLRNYNFRISTSTRSKVKSHLNGYKESTSAMPKSKSKLINILKPKFTREKEQNSTLIDMRKNSFESSAEGSLKRKTRQSTRKEALSESSSKDLLVLRKEEIIKQRPFKTPMSSKPKHTSTPKSKKNNLVSDNEKIPSKNASNNEYTFERLNFDNEVQENCVTLENDELEIKKEVVSDSDDDFTEDASCIINETGIVEEEQCPNLDVFIKTEPTEIMDLNEDEIEPPQLEFQGPCNYDPKFTISNTFTVVDKRHITTVDDKRDLLNMTTEYSQTSSSATMAKNKTPAAPSLPKFNNEIAPVLPVLTMKNESITNQKIIHKEAIIRLTKCDVKPMPDIVNCDKKVTSELKPKNAVSVKSGTTEMNSPPEMLPITTIDRSLPGNFLEKIIRASLENTKSAEMSNKNFGNINPDTNASPIRNRASLPNNHEKAKHDSTINLNQRMLVASDMYREVDELNLSKSNPFVCKMCDFKTPSRKGAKCHISLHERNTAVLHRCDFCSYQSTCKSNLKAHKRLNNHLGSPDQLLEGTKNCAYCLTSKPEINCLLCKRSFHLDCMLREGKMKKFTCFHYSLSKCIVIMRNGNIASSPGSVKRCSSCKIPVRKWISCEQCMKIFHYMCFFLTASDGKNSCPHFFIHRTSTQVKQNHARVVETSVMPVSSRGKKAEQKSKCDYCAKSLICVIPCPKCSKFMHATCFQKDSKQMKFNCKHEDMVSDLPADSGATVMPKLEAAPSKKLKEEMLDLSDFIMLCD